jgi:eukaryotic-like serine/threonine-protein kinase
MTPHTDGDDSRLAELLLRWEELHDEGRTVTPDELCSTCPELAEELGRRIALLRQLDPLLDGKTNADGAQQRRTAAGAPSRESATARAEFRDLRFHAAGALGEVFMARNAELNREVALKFLKPERLRDADSRRRFLQEAEITGRLEHPGVVPIYALGTDAAGSPCYAMRFIRGETLQDAIDAFHAAEKAGRNPSERSLALRDLLDRFVSICSTMAYAHSRGILHRDLKPRNVMLGKYDETLVVDWGLARPFDRDEAARSVGEETLTPSAAGMEGGSDTPTVGVVGTPAYMSPEQAEARWDLVGPASDQFSLGGILYAILTGLPPYRGRKVNDLLEKVKRHEFPTPRQVKPGVPRALEAICLKAMAMKPEDRYATALDLAADVRRWLADEPVSAWREPAMVRARRWMRRHRTLVTTAAATGAVALLILGAAYTRESTIRARLAVANQRLDEANRLVNDAKAESDRRLDQAFQAIEDYYTGVNQEFLLRQKDFQTLRQRLLERPRQFYEQLTGELESSRTPDDRTRLLLARGWRGLGRISQAVARFDEAASQYEKAIGLFHRLTTARPDVADYRQGLALSYANRARLQAYTKDARGAVESVREAMATWTKIDDDRGLTDARRGLAECYSILGHARMTLGDARGAAESFRQAIARFDRLVASDPRLPAFREGLADGYQDLAIIQHGAGDVSGALESFRRAIAIADELAAGNRDVARYQQRLAGLHNSHAVLLEDTGEMRAAERSHRLANTFFARLVANHPNVPQLADQLAMSHANLGNVQALLGDRAGAVESYRQAIAIRIRLMEAWPQIADYPNGLAETYSGLGIAQLQAGDLVGAMASHRRVIELETDLSAAHPDVPEYREELSRGHNNLGEVQHAAADFAGEAESYHRASALASQLVAAHPDSLEYKSLLGLYLHNLGSAFCNLGRFQEAEDSFRQAIDHHRSVHERAPRMTRFGQFLNEDYRDLSRLLRDQGRWREAVAMARLRKRQWGNDPRELYNTACELALCVPFADDPGQREALAAEASQVLGDSMAAGFSNTQLISRDPDLLPLRDRDDFRRLLDDLFDRGFPADPFAR